MELKDAEKLISKSKVCFIGSVDKDGYPYIKAMLKPRKRNSIKEFWLSTNTSALRTRQYIDNSQACLYFYKKGLINYRGVMLKGNMQVLEDEKSKRSIWRKGDTIFYKGGVTDPDYCVLKFTAESGKYYCNLKKFDFNIDG